MPQNCYWTQEQIDILIFIAEILCTFLLKQRVEEQYRQESLSLKMILDNQKAWIYVIDPIEFRLLFINESTKEIVSKAKLGMTCYEAFFNSTKRCENCPAEKVGKLCRNAMSEIYNPELKIWTIADSSFITWMGKDAILLSCNDITRFKK